MKYFQGIFALFVLIFILVALLVPDDSLFKHIFAYLSALVLLSVAVWFTPIGNPLKRFLRKKGWLK